MIVDTDSEKWMTVSKIQTQCQVHYMPGWIQGGSELSPWGNFKAEHKKMESKVV